MPRFIITFDADNTPHLRLRCHYYATLLVYYAPHCHGQYATAVHILPLLLYATGYHYATLAFAARAASHYAISCMAMMSLTPLRWSSSASGLCWPLRH